ncbi:MAG: copper homeostasis periplasmic binding protein CopC [Pseudomonadota bacterium]
MKFQMTSVALLASLWTAAPASAHPKLIAAVPAENATVAHPSKIQLTFSEQLMPKLSGGTLVMTAMPGMGGDSLMSVGKVKSTIGADGKSLILSSAAPLKAGTYLVDWHTASTDGHRAAGKYSFTVR